MLNTINFANDRIFDMCALALNNHNIYELPKLEPETTFKVLSDKANTQDAESYDIILRSDSKGLYCFIIVFYKKVDDFDSYTSTYFVIV